MHHRHLLAASAAALAAFLSAPASADVTIHTAPFITDPVASTGFEDVALLDTRFNSPVISGGVSATYMQQNPPPTNCCVFTGIPGFDGKNSWYANIYSGYTSLKLASGATFSQIQFLAAGGTWPDAGDLMYSLLLGGTVIASGSAGPLNEFTHSPATTFGFSGATFDEVRLWNPAIPGNDTLGLDNIVIGNVAAVPEPASWALMLGGFGFLGAALRRQRSLRLTPSPA